MAVIILGTA